MHNTIVRRTRSRRFATLLGTGVLGMCVAFSGCMRSPQEKEARYLESGKRLFESKDYARAAIQFMNAAKTMPNDAEPRYQLALVYLAQRQRESAIRSLQTAINLNRNHEQAQLKLAELMIALGDKQKVEEGQQKLQQLLNTMPPNAELLDALAAAEWKLGNRQDAEKQFEEAVSKFPQHLVSAVALARVKRAHNDLPGAEAVLQKAAAQM